MASNSRRGPHPAFSNGGLPNSGPNPAFGNGGLPRRSPGYVNGRIAGRIGADVAGEGLVGSRRRGGGARTAAEGVQAFAGRNKPRSGAAGRGPGGVRGGGTGSVPRSGGGSAPRSGGGSAPRSGGGSAPRSGGGSAPRRGYTDTLTAGKPKFSGRDVVGDGKNKGDGSGKNKSTGRITKGRATGKPRSKGSSSDDRFIDSSYVGDYKEGSPKGVKYKAWLADTGRKSTSNLAAIWSHANGRELNAQMLASAAGRRIAAKKDKPKPPKAERGIPRGQSQHPITERRQQPPKPAGDRKPPAPSDARPWNNKRGQR